MEQAIHMIITSAIGYIIAHYIVKALDNIRKLVSKSPKLKDKKKRGRNKNRSLNAIAL